MCDKLKKLIFAVAMIMIITIYSIFILNLTQNRNINFDSQELFIEGGYKEVHENSLEKQKEHKQYLIDNSQRLNGYGVDFENLINEIEDGRLEASLKSLNEAESNTNNKKLFKEDVLMLLRYDFLTLNIKAYEMVENNEVTGRDKLYQRLKNIEIIYDAYGNGLEINEVSIKDTTGSSLINNDLKSWSSQISRRKINIIIMIYTLIAIVLIIYHFIKDKETTLLIIFTLVLITTIFTYRKIEDNYYPPYSQINNMFGVNQNTNGDYFINFIPIVVANTFVENGGTFTTVEANGEIKQVDWTKSKGIEKWQDSPYQGSPKISNSEILERIRSEMELPLFEYVDNNLITGNNGWNFSGI